MFKGVEEAGRGLYTCSKDQPAPEYAPVHVFKGPKEAQRAPGTRVKGAWRRLGGPVHVFKGPSRPGGSRRQLFQISRQSFHDSSTSNDVH